MIDKNNHETHFPLTAFENKPLELYFFIDPLCPDCNALEPVIKKLQIEYGHYFTLTYVLTGKLTNFYPVSKNSFTMRDTITLHETIHKTCIDCDDLVAEVNLDTPFLASIAIKAAELQGRKAGIRYLRKLQEYIFFKKEDINDLNTLIRCAKDAQLDIEEFTFDIHSPSTFHAFECDLKITEEMGVKEIPSVVLFNNNIDEAGLKLSGIYSYDVYIEVISEILGKNPVSHPLPSLLTFIRNYQPVTTGEIAFIYNISHLEVEREMKKLSLQQIVHKVHLSSGTFWRYTGEV